MTIDKKNICCPSCGKKNTWQSDNDSKPFCSPRCKLIDLGDWADEQHKIPGDPVHIDDADNPEEN
jgi:endogenous inhibitor of DNA gyrase (YacG/DUF329 family)